jgi:hypothetical protein
MLLNELFENNLTDFKQPMLLSTNSLLNLDNNINITEERIVQAAFRIPETGKIYPCGSFHDVAALPADTDFDFNTLESGFLTDTGKFLDRKTAAKLTHLKKASTRNSKQLHSFNVAGLGTEQDRQLFHPEQVSPVLR